MFCGPGAKGDSLGAAVSAVAKGDSLVAARSAVWPRLLGSVAHLTQREWGSRGSKLLQLCLHWVIHGCAWPCRVVAGRTDARALTWHSSQRSPKCRVLVGWVGSIPGLFSPWHHLEWMVVDRGGWVVKKNLIEAAAMRL